MASREMKNTSCCRPPGTVLGPLHVSGRSLQLLVVRKARPLTEQKNARQNKTEHSAGISRNGDATAGLAMGGYNTETWRGGGGTKSAEAPCKVGAKRDGRAGIRERGWHVVQGCC